MLKHYSHLANNLLSTTSTQTIQWTEQTIKALTDIKQALAQATLLLHPKQDSPTCIMTDASNVALQLVVTMLNKNTWA